VKTGIKGSFLSLILLTGLQLGAVAAPQPGQPAPDFTLPSSQGNPVTLSSFKGKYVVLEWTNHECPFVRKHYDSGNMQKLQKTYTDKGVIWLTINSSAEGKEGYVTAKQAEDNRASDKSNATAVLLDPEGKVGHLYQAKTTPHMFVINPAGQVVYMGAIDNRPTVDQADIAGAKNYVALALDQVMAGKPVAESATKPYGCSVKYH